MRKEHKTPAIISAELDAAHASTEGSAAWDEVQKHWNPEEVEYYILVLLHEMYKLQMAQPPVPTVDQRTEYKFQIPAGTYDTAAIETLVQAIDPAVTHLHAIEVESRPENTAYVTLELPTGNPAPVQIGLGGTERWCAHADPTTETYSPLTEDFKILATGTDTIIIRVTAITTI